MEFEGRITKLLPLESGIRKDGTEWKNLPFVFEYYEKLEDRWPEHAKLTARDPKHLAMIARYIALDADKKPIIENKCMKLTSEIPCRCGFGHRVNEGERKDGSGWYCINELPLYRLEPIEAKQRPQDIFPPVQQPTAQPAAQEKTDDLPF